MGLSTVFNSKWEHYREKTGQNRIGVREPQKSQKHCVNNGEKYHVVSAASHTIKVSSTSELYEMFATEHDETI